MNATLDPTERSHLDGRAPDRTYRSTPRRRRVSLRERLFPWHLAVTIGLFVGVALLCVAYAAASTRPGRGLEFPIFWAGIAAFLIPTSVYLFSEKPARDSRLALLVIVGLFIALPKFLRSPLRPVFADEMAHWRQTELSGRLGELFLDNPFVGVVDSFPGLHAASIAIRDLTGLPTHATAVLLVFSALVLDVVGVFVLAERLLGSPRAASVAALVYAANPSIMFFDTQYAYESLALPVLIWSLVAVSGVIRPGIDRRERTRWIVVASVLGAFLVTTHHLTSLMLIAYLVALVPALVWQMFRSRASKAPLVPVVLLMVGLAVGLAGWFVFVTSGLKEYLGSYVSRSAGDLTRIATGSQQKRQLFKASTAPLWEQYSAFIAPGIVAAAMVAGLFLLHRRRPFPPMLFSLSVLALGYLGSVPIVLTASGAEAVRRTWAFTYIGVAVLAGLGLVFLLDRLPKPLRRTLTVVAPLLYLILQIGNVSAGQSVEYRFPGAYVYGSDTRSLTSELRGAVHWFTDTQGESRRLVTDRSGTLAFSLLGLHWSEKPWRGLPLWEIYFSPERPSAKMLETLERKNTDYLVVDKRMYSELPRTGVYVIRDEPGAKQHQAPPTRAALDRLERVPWLRQIYETDHYEIFRFDLDSLNNCTDQLLEAGLNPRACKNQPAG